MGAEGCLAAPKWGPLTCGVDEPAQVILTQPGKDPEPAWAEDGPAEIASIVANLRVAGTKASGGSSRDAASLPVGASSSRAARPSWRRLRPGEASRRWANADLRV